MGLLGSIIRVALDVAETPIAVIKDVATLGGVITDQTKPYTIKKLEELGDDYEEMKDKLTK